MLVCTCSFFFCIQINFDEKNISLYSAHVSLCKKQFVYRTFTPFHNLEEKKSVMATSTVNDGLLFEEYVLACVKQEGLILKDKLLEALKQLF